MSQLSENLVAHLDPAQALELVRVMEIQAFWENLREAVGQKDLPTSHLKDRQKAYEAYRTRLAAYTSKYRTFPLPELTQNSPKWAVQWFRVVRAVLLRTKDAPLSDIPNELMSKAHRLGDRIATRLKNPPLAAFTRPTSWDAAAAQIETLLAAGGEQATPPEVEMRAAA